jgi:hypothetical protein
MRTTTLKKGIRNIFLGTLFAIAVYSFASCARKINFLTSTVVPAARGTVKVKKDHNNNYVIQITIADLAEVERLQPPKQVYIVWMLGEDAVIKNLGKINSSTGSLTQNLKASFETVSSSKPVKIFITAEDDANVQSPGTMVVLSTDNF